MCYDPNSSGTIRDSLSELCLFASLRLGLGDLGCPCAICSIDTAQHSTAHSNSLCVESVCLSVCLFALHVYLPVPAVQLLAWDERRFPAYEGLGLNECRQQNPRETRKRIGVPRVLKRVVASVWMDASVVRLPGYVLACRPQSKGPVLDSEVSMEMLVWSSSHFAPRSIVDILYRGSSRY